MNRHGMTLIFLENLLFLGGCWLFALAIAELAIGHKLETGACYAVATYVLWIPAWWLAGFRDRLRRQLEAQELSQAMLDDMAKKAFMIKAMAARNPVGLRPELN